MLLDVVLPTHNRCELVARTIESLVQARVPAGLSITVTVVDNNSRDATRETVEGWVARAPWPLRYLFEPAPGKSHALNAGIRAARGDLIGMIDDDEEVDEGWFEAIARAFAQPDVDFIGGACVPLWEAEPPSWLPRRPSAVIGWVDGGPAVRTYGVDYDGVLMGGNAVVKRSLLLGVGLYDPSLGPSAENRLLSCEDEDMYVRLLASGARGQYRPDLVIRHFVPVSRMTVAYHRRWFFWQAVSLGLRDRSAREPVPYFLGIPRYVVGEAVRGALALTVGRLRPGGPRNPHERFDALMALHRAAGFLYGKHAFRSRATRTPPVAPVPQAGTVPV